MNQRTRILITLAALAFLATASSAQAMLHPGQGRFLQRDPGGFRDGPSLYESRRNNPVRWVDREGMQATQPTTKPGGPEAGGLVTLVPIEVRGAPWYWMTNYDETIVNRLLDGVAFVRPNVTCSCVCLKARWHHRCEIKLEGRIYINTRVRGQPGEPGQTYGHEQKHLQSYNYWVSTVAVPAANAWLESNSYNLQGTCENNTHKAVAHATAACSKSDEASDHQGGPLNSPGLTPYSPPEGGGVDPVGPVPAPGNDPSAPARIQTGGSRRGVPDWLWNDPWRYSPVTEPVRF